MPIRLPVAAAPHQGESHVAVARSCAALGPRRGPADSPWRLFRVAARSAHAPRCTLRASAPPGSRGNAHTLSTDRAARPHCRGCAIRLALDRGSDRRLFQIFRERCAFGFPRSAAVLQLAVVVAVSAPILRLFGLGIFTLALLMPLAVGEAWH